MKNKVDIILTYKDTKLGESHAFSVEFDLTALKIYGDDLRYPDDDFDLVRGDYDIAIKTIADSLFNCLFRKCDTFGKRMLEIYRRKDELQKEKEERK
jgi:hypothetical protein